MGGVCKEKDTGRDRQRSLSVAPKSRLFCVVATDATTMEENSDHGTWEERHKSKGTLCHFFFLFLPHRTALISFLPLTSPLLATPFRSRNHATSLTLKNKGSSDDLGSLSLSHSLFDSFVHCLACASFIACLLVFLLLLFCVLITSFCRPSHRSPPDGHCTYLQPLRAPGHGRLVKNLGLYSLRHLVGRLGNP